MTRFIALPIKANINITYRAMLAVTQGKVQDFLSSTLVMLMICSREQSRESGSSSTSLLAVASSSPLSRITYNIYTRIEVAITPRANWTTMTTEDIILILNQCKSVPCV